MKTCPYCQEQVKDDAIRCSHCSSWLESRANGEAAVDSIVYVLDRGIVRFAKFAMAILAMFLIVGAFFYGFDLKEASKEIAEAKEKTIALEKELVKELDTVVALKEDAERLKTELVAERETVANLKREMVEQAQVSKKHFEEVVGYRTRAREIVASISTSGVDEAHIATVVKRVLVRDLSEAIPAELRHELEKAATPRSGSVAEIIEQTAFETIGLTRQLDDSGDLSPVKVAILSESFSSSLQSLQPYLIAGKDFLTFEPPAEYNRYPITDHFSGIASLIAAVSPKAKILPIRVLSPNAGMATISDVENGLYFALAEGARVIVLPFGAPGGDERIYRDFLKQARTRDVVVVAAAGNTASTSKVYPAAIPDVLSVATTDAKDQLTGWTSYGDWVSLAAPGENVTIIGDDGKLKTTNGGSFSTAIAAGAVALMFSIDPHVSAAQVRNMLIETASRLPDSPDAPQRTIRGGRIDLIAAISKLKAMPPHERRESPAVSSDPVLDADGVTVHKVTSEREKIPDSDPSGLKSSISIDSAGIITDIRLDVNIKHTWVGDIRIVLSTPTGEELTIRDRLGGSSGEILDSYTTERVPGLKALIGVAARGDWTLIISDHAQQDVGALEQWGIELTVDSKPS